MIQYQAPAKINLSLNIYDKTDNGYHCLQGIAIFADISDDISITTNNHDGFMLHITGDFAHMLPHNHDDNIITKAVIAFCKHYRCHADIHITLQKNLPIGAGIGGGSSDAATILHACNEIFNIYAPINELSNIAIELGADVPMCLYQKPLFYQHVGNDITLLPNITLPQNIILIKPKQSLLTKDVFAHIKKVDIHKKYYNHHDNICDHISYFGNDLLPIAKKLCPDINDILTILSQNDNIVANGMSGSGSCCFGLYNHHHSILDDIIAQCNKRNYWYRIGKVL